MNLRRLTIVLHRDIGYFVSGLVLVYCISGLALNHVDDWNPDFVIERRPITVERSLTRDEVSQSWILGLSSRVGEGDYKVFDFPTASQLKIYYDNASLLIDLDKRSGVYERVVRRPLVFQTNIIHRNSIKGWKWASDLFALLLIVITITGFFMLRGKTGITGRGKWLILAGVIPPVVAVILFELVQR